MIRNAKSDKECERVIRNTKNEIVNKEMKGRWPDEPRAVGNLALSRKTAKCCQCSCLVFIAVASVLYVLDVPRC